MSYIYTKSHEAGVNISIFISMIEYYRRRGINAFLL